ncbi:MAG: DUF2721 domain-containing protein [Thermodesulfobacteriota bacterium]
MEITLTTPALLFPAISLLLVAYTNRFVALGSRVRALYSLYKEEPDEILAGQIANLKKRLILIRNMQGCGVISLFSCVVCMFALFWGFILAGKIIFGLSLVLMMASLGISLREITISIDALNLELSDMQKASITGTEER